MTDSTRPGFSACRGAGPRERVRCGSSARRYSPGPGSWPAPCRGQRTFALSWPSTWPACRCAARRADATSSVRLAFTAGTGAVTELHLIRTVSISASG